MRLLLLSVLLASSSAMAHPLDESLDAVDIHDDGLVFELNWPIAELSRALGATPTSDSVRARVADHVGVVDDRGAPVAIAVTDVAGLDGSIVREGAPQIVVTLSAPTSHALRRFTLTDTAIVAGVQEHRVLVEVRRDFAGGVLHEPVLVGVIDAARPALVVDRGAGAWRTGYAAVFGLGAHHIRGGTDHLLFLLVLLLPATMLAVDRRWRTPAPIAVAVKRIALIVTAFTLGHSVTLALAAFDIVTLPSQPVEIVIALSIAASAVHAVRPIFPGREAAIAAGFGLVHGLAFASTLAELGVRGTALVWSLLAFNLGIEAMQLLVVVVVMPSLLLVARTPLGTPLRVGGAVVAGVAALAWAFERVTSTTTTLTITVEAVAVHGHWLVGGLFGVAVLATIWTRRHRTP